MHYAVWAAGRARPGRRRDALLRRADALRNHLVVGHTGLVAAGVARAAARGLTPGVGPDDLWAEAQLTLLKAVAHFDPWRGWQLSTYVYRAVYVQLRRQVEACRRRRGPAGTLAADALAADAEAASGFDLLGCGGGADAVDRWIEAADARARTGRALSALPAPLRQTVCDQFGLHGHRERTVREVAARDHTAARRVRRRRAAALERVREALVYA
jgi:DNA-directed RNA polymerase sigma subunit (sigma70/sigma32)